MIRKIGVTGQRTRQNDIRFYRARESSLQITNPVASLRAWAVRARDGEIDARSSRGLVFIRNLHGSYSSTCAFKLMMGRNDRLSSLNAAIDALGLARDATTTKSAQDAFGPAIFLLTTIKVGLLGHPGLSLTDLCRTR